MQERNHVFTLDEDVCFACVAVVCLVLGTFVGYALTIFVGHRSHSDEKGHERTIVVQEDKLRTTHSPTSENFEVPTLNPNNAPAFDSGDSSDAKKIKVVIQRFRRAKLLVYDDEDSSKKYVAVGSKIDADVDEETNQSLHLHPGGILVYISFSKSAESGMIHPAARTVLNLPVVTRGLWGDGSKPRSVLKLASECYLERQSRGDTTGNSSSGLSVVIVPQANLVSKIKSAGKSIQYHSQIEKEKGHELFQLFCNAAKEIALEHKKILVSGEAMISSSRKQAKQENDPSLPPNELFRDPLSFSKWDESTGLPIEDVGGNPVTKSAMKRMSKLYEAQKKRHEKYLSHLTILEGGDRDDVRTSVVLENNPTRENPPTEEQLQPDFLTVVQGTFGKRQALEFLSDMGPFCHVLDLG